MEWNIVMGITILLADSTPSVRQIERKLLEKESDIEVVGEARDEHNALKLVSSLNPQIVLTDFNVRSPEKILAKQVKSQNPKTKVLGVTELKGRYVKNFLKVFGVDELLDIRELENKLIRTVRLVALAKI
jgi:DNA-binding NarL/FixJ family response regulator